MDQCNPSCRMRMGIGIGNTTMGGPSGMAYATGRFIAARCQNFIPQTGNLSDRFDRSYFMIGKERNAGTVIAPVFQSLQSIDQGFLCVPLSNTSNNSAHNEISFIYDIKIL